MAGKAEDKVRQEAGSEQGTQRSRFGGAPVQPIRQQEQDTEIEEVDQDPGERQKRNQGDIEEDKLAS